MSRLRIILILAVLAVGFGIVGTIDYNAIEPAPTEAPATLAPPRTNNDPIHPPAARCGLIGLQEFSTRADGKPWRVTCVIADARTGRTPG